MSHRRLPHWTTVWMWCDAHAGVTRQASGRCCFSTTSTGEWTQFCNRPGRRLFRPVCHRVCLHDRLLPLPPCLRWSLIWEDSVKANWSPHLVWFVSSNAKYIGTRTRVTGQDINCLSVRLLPSQLLLKLVQQLFPWIWLMISIRSKNVKKKKKKSMFSIPVTA